MLVGIFGNSRGLGIVIIVAFSYRVKINGVGASVKDVRKQKLHSTSSFYMGFEHK